MIDLSSRLENKLDLVKEIALLLQYLDFSELQGTNEKVEFFAIGELIRVTLGELDSEMEQIHDSWRKKCSDLRKKLPADPKAELQELQDDVKYLCHAAKYLLKRRPGLAPAFEAFLGSMSASLKTDQATAPTNDE